jgi:Uma2 family endonuclease
MASVTSIDRREETQREDPAPRRWTVEEWQRIRHLGVLAGRSILLQDGELLENVGDGRSPVSFDRSDYQALDDAGFFLGQRAHLVGGRILVDSPKKPAHAVGVLLATRALGTIFGEGFDIRVQLPLDLGPYSQPQPDLAVVPGSPRDYLDNHLRSAVLIVEVSESTLEMDTHEKANLYAAAAIADYWGIDVSGRLLIFRDPQPAEAQPYGHTYRRLTAHGRDEQAAPLAAPERKVCVADLLP